MSDALAPTVSDELEQWLGSDQPKTLGNLTELFGPRSFALVFVLLMALPALPLPTGGATHVFEVVTMLVALQLVVGRRGIWLPARGQRLQLAGPSRERLLNALLQRIRWLERFSRPRATSLFDHRATTSAFGLLVFGLTLSAFLAPPFSGLDTLPSLGVVVIGLGVLNRDIVLALAGAVIGAVGVATVLALGNLVVKAAQHVV
ncbi:MAG: exopolysaccharide biosynthesis protein [Solirubrobacteraceae bacterium]